VLDLGEAISLTHPILALAGLAGHADALPLWIGWVTYLSPFRFAYNSLMVNEFDGLLIYFDPLGVEVRVGWPWSRSAPTSALTETVGEYEHIAAGSHRTSLGG